MQEDEAAAADEAPVTDDEYAEDEAGDGRRRGGRRLGCRGRGRIAVLMPIRTCGVP